MTHERLLIVQCARLSLPQCAYNRRQKRVQESFPIDLLNGTKWASRQYSQLLVIHFLVCSMVLYELWNTEVASETPFLSLSINRSLREFGHHEHLKPIQSEAVQTLHQGQDVFVNVYSCRLRKVADLPGATCHAALTLKRPRLRKAAVSVQVIQIPTATQQASTCTQNYVSPIHHCHLFNTYGIK